MKPLSANQEAMLLRLFQGDEPSTTVDGLYWLEAPEERVDSRTLQSLISRHLVSVATGVGSGMMRQGFRLTECGTKIAEQLDDAAYQKLQAQRGW